MFINISVLLFGVLIYNVEYSIQFKSESELIDKLFQNYTREARPVVHIKDTVNVKLTCGVSKIKEFSTKKQFLSIFAWMYIVWRDERLAWNTSEYETESIVLPGSKVWLPTIVIYNSASDSSIIQTGMNYLK